MTERQKQHQGRSEGDETMLEGRDIRADTPDGIGTDRVNGAIEGGAQASQAALLIEALVETNRKRTAENER